MDISIVLDRNKVINSEFTEYILSEIELIDTVDKNKLLVLTYRDTYWYCAVCMHTWMVEIVFSILSLTGSWTLMKLSEDDVYQLVHSIGIFIQNSFGVLFWQVQLQPLTLQKKWIGGWRKYVTFSLKQHLKLFC